MTDPTPAHVIHAALANIDPNAPRIPTRDIAALLGIAQAVTDYATLLADRAAMLADQPGGHVYAEVSTVLLDVAAAFLTPFGATASAA